MPDGAWEPARVARASEWGDTVLDRFLALRYGLSGGNLPGRSLQTRRGRGALLSWRSQASGVLLGGSLRVTSIRMVLVRPSATSTVDTTRSLFSAVGVSGLGGGKPIRAIVADIHPIHHPLHTSRSVFRL